MTIRLGRRLRVDFVGPDRRRRARTRRCERSRDACLYPGASGTVVEGGRASTHRGDCDRPRTADTGTRSGRHPFRLTGRSQGCHGTAKRRSGRRVPGSRAPASGRPRGPSRVRPGCCNRRQARSVSGEDDRSTDRRARGAFGDRARAATPRPTVVQGASGPDPRVASSTAACGPPPSFGRASSADNTSSVTRRLRARVSAEVFAVSGRNSA